MTMVETVHKRLSELLHKPFEQLTGLSSCTSEKIDAGGETFTLSVWHDLLTSGEHRIVVQGYRALLLGIGQTCAEGFAVNPQNEKRALTADELASFT